MGLTSDPVLVSLATGREVDVWPNGSMSVQLPGSVLPAFGTACVVCGLEPPKQPIRRGDVPSWTWARSVLMPSRLVPTPPACRRCATSSAAMRAFGVVADLGAIACAGLVARAWGWEWPARVALAIVAPVVVDLLWRWAAPAWFTVGRGLAPRTLSYTFRRRDVAVDFAYKNAAPCDDADAQGEDDAAPA